MALVLAFLRPISPNPKPFGIHFYTSLPIGQGSNPSSFDLVDPDETPTTLSPENNESEAEFEPSDCFLPKGRGPCRAIIEQFFFNTATKSCEVFGWSGCGGNKNRFATKDACELNCRQPTVPVEQPSLTTAEVMPSTKAPLMTKHKLPTCPTFTGCGPKCVIIQDRSDMGCKRCLCGAGGPDKRYTQDIPAAVIVSSGMNVTITKTSEVSIGSVSGVPMDIDEEEDVPIAGIFLNLKIMKMM